MTASSPGRRRRSPPAPGTFKIAHDQSWTENYGDGGVRDGADMSVTVPSDGATTNFVYDSATHRTTVTSVAAEPR